MWARRGVELEFDCSIMLNVRLGDEELNEKGSEMLLNLEFSEAESETGRV